MFCPNCGNKLADDAKFCNACGAPIGTTEAAPTGQPTYTQATYAQAAPNQYVAPQASTMPAAGKLFGSNKLLAIASIVASALLIVAYSMTLVTIGLAGSTYSYNAMSLDKCISELGLSGDLASTFGACSGAMLVAAFFGAVSIVVFLIVKSVKVRSIIEIVLGSLAAIIGFCASSYINELINQLGILANNSFVSSVTGSSISAGIAPTLVTGAGIAIITLNVVMLIDARKNSAVA